MVTLPREFTATRFPGYFWNTETQTLFSLKISGELHQLKQARPNRFNRINEPGYYASVKGQRRFMSISYLKGLKVKDSEIGIERKDHGIF